MFRGTPTRIWLDHVFSTVFDIDERLTSESADRYYDRIAACLAKPAFRPRAACDLGYRTIVVSDACTADSDEAHTRALDVVQKWFGETPTADEVFSALG